jgi:sirohydrochlorin cobaltochelatase
VKRGLLLIDHGSRAPEANAHVDEIARELRRRRPGMPVYVAHLEVARPSIAEAVAEAARDGVTELVAHPFFLTPGRHAASDVPHALWAAAADHPGLAVRLTPATGEAAGLVDLILATLPEN